MTPPPSDARGCVLVPREPTEAIDQAMHRAIDALGEPILSIAALRAAYRAAVTAAPIPPVDRDAIRRAALEEAAYDLAFRAADLTTATDGQDSIREQRVAVLDALKKYAAARRALATGDAS